MNIKSFYPPELQEEAQDAEQKILAPLEDDDDDSDEDLDLILDSETIERNTEELFVDIDDIELVDEEVDEITEMIQVDEKNKTIWYRNTNPRYFRRIISRISF